MIKNCKLDLNSVAKNPGGIFTDGKAEENKEAFCGSLPLRNWRVVHYEYKNRLFVLCEK